MLKLSRQMDDGEMRNVILSVNNKYETTCKLNQ